jgi:hypothetical protein
MEIRHFCTLCIEQPPEILFNRVFTKENTTSSLRESSSPFFLQKFGPLTPLKATDRFTSLTIIGMKKIMCNRGPLEFPLIEKIFVVCLGSGRDW